MSRPPTRWVGVNAILCVLVAPAVLVAISVTKSLSLGGNLNHKFAEESFLLPTPITQEHGLVVPVPRTSVPTAGEGTKAARVESHSALKDSTKAANLMVEASPFIARTSNTSLARIHFCESCQKSVFLVGSTNKSCAEHLRTKLGIQTIRQGSLIDIKKALLDGLSILPACSTCNPTNCSVQRQCPLAYDMASPPIYRSKTFDSLQSIPSNRQVPIDKQQFRMNFRLNVTPTALAVYNPSIIQLPPETKASLLAAAFNRSEPSYLVSFRVSDVGACGVLDDAQFNWRLYGSNLLGLAILDENLEIMEQAILDINGQVKTVSANQFEDYRLFYLSGTLYLSHQYFILPIQVLYIAVPQSVSRPTSYVIPALYGSPNLQVSIPAGRSNRIYEIPNFPYRGKNFQFFTGEDKQIYVEFWPRPHMVGRMEKNMMSIVDYPPFKPPDYVAPSFLSHHSVSTTNDRGSACCIILEREYAPPQAAKYWSNHSFLFMGISHTKSSDKKKKKKKKNLKIYLSRLYAFPPKPPFTLVAVSGEFCLPAGDSRLASKASMQVRSLRYECPSIHYISGMVASGEHVLVSYGIDDCYSRIVEFHKRDLAFRLFTTMGTVQNIA